MRFFALAYTSIKIDLPSIKNSVSNLLKSKYFYALIASSCFKVVFEIFDKMPRHS